MASSKNRGAETKRKEAAVTKTATKTIAKTKNETNSSRGSSRKVEQKKKKKNEKKISNGSTKESAVLPISTSSSDSLRETPEDERAETTSRRANGSTSKSKKRKGDLENGFEDRDEEKDEGKIYRIPLNRVKTIMKSENSDLRINQDALFLVNIAAEKFLEQFCQEAYTFSAKDRKKSLAYKNLSSVVAKQKRYDFLSDFVPEKLKAEDALAAMKLAETEAS